MRKAIFAAVLLMGILVTQGYAQASPDSLWAEANEKYLQQDYAAAEMAYKSLLDKGYQSAELYFNLGNTYFKQNNIPLSILFYERALLLAPNDEDIQYNHELANTLIVDKIEAIPDILPLAWYRDFIRLMQVKTWAYASALLFVLGILLIIAFYALPGMPLRMQSFYFGLFGVLISFMMLFFAFERKQLITENKDAIIMAPTVSVKGMPSQSGTTLFIVHEGTKAQVLDKVGDYVEIRIADGSKGWMRESDLARVYVY